MILYANQNHPNLKTEYPIWADRIKQIAKIWKNLPNDKRQPYVQAARENRTASRMNKQDPLVKLRFGFHRNTCIPVGVPKSWSKFNVNTPNVGRPMPDQQNQPQLM